MDGPDDDEVPTEVRAQAVIEGVAAFASDLPINVEMRPYRNHHTQQVQGVILTDLFAAEPGKGVGSSVVREILRLAEEADVSVYTDAEGPRSAEFYRKMGFQASSGRGHQFAWHPPLPDYLRDDDDVSEPAPGPR